MTAATLFSGIGAPEQAMPSWEWLWSAEIERFPSAVLAARHPSSVNLGDVTADDFCERARAIGRPNVLVFGSPCQSFSVAGRRLGLDDPRGNLALLALRIVKQLEPAWFVFENVPGLLSSGGGRDFGLFLRAVDELGCGVAWTVLDAQYAGVAQRRARVFVVGCPRADWRRAAAVLLEPESLCGHSPTRGEAREDITGTLEARTKGGGGHFGIDFNCLSGLQVANTRERARALTSSSQRIDAETETLISVFDPRQITCPDNRIQPTPGLAHTLHASAPVAYQCQGSNVGEMGTLRAGNGNETGGVPFTFGWNKSASQTMRVDADTAPALQASETSNPAVLMSGVRRLMPVECERLQGFPDGYTAITYRGKPAKDGPRYKAIGNSMAVPVIGWILQRIELLEELVPERVA